MRNTTDANREVTTRFIEAFNTSDWDTVREVVAPGFVSHHPDGGTVAAGPEGIVAAWSEFKAALPDAWHPIPVMIAEKDSVAVLLPTYGRFTGDAYHGVPPTGEPLECGMVNIVRLEHGRLAEAWFGMDSLAEKQEMGIAPRSQTRRLSPKETANIALFQRTINTAGWEHDTVTAFGDVVVTIGPPQDAEDAKMRTLEMYRIEDGAVSLMRSHEFPTVPPFGGALWADTDLSRGVVERFFGEVLIGHDLDALEEIASPDILVHPTAMPCEAGYYGIAGTEGWLSELWDAFPDVTVDDSDTVASGDLVAVRWAAHGTSGGDFMGLPASGREVGFTGVSMYRIEDGKLAEIWETRNTLGLMAQLNPTLAAAHE